MCTVTYIPLQSTSQKFETFGKVIGSNFLLTSNRDENTARTTAFLPEIFHINNKKVVIPFDPVGKGSWIAAEENGRTVCLLNGAFEPHLPQPPYRHSRGLIVTKYFNFRNLHDFTALFDFTGLEPFTLVVAEYGKLWELRWDFAKLNIAELNEHKPYIWSSVTLYSPDVRLQRAWLFTEWVAKNYEALQLNTDLIFDFHLNENSDIESIAINRNNVMQTVSTTAVKVENQSVALQYRDLINHQNETIRFGIQALKTAF